MMTSLPNMNAFSYQSMATSGAGGKLVVPVNKNALLYSHFSHISGVAAKSGQQGVSISKIRILNSLIDRLSAIKNQPSDPISKISDDQADVLIKAYQKQIQQTVSQSPYLIAGAKPQAGALFAIDA